MLSKDMYEGVRMAKTSDIPSINSYIYIHIYEPFPADVTSPGRYCFSSTKSFDTVTPHLCFIHTDIYDLYVFYVRHAVVAFFSRDRLHALPFVSVCFVFEIFIAKCTVVVHDHTHECVILLLHLCTY
jgi:hypothetical protein